MDNEPHNICPDESEGMIIISDGEPPRLMIRSKFNIHNVHVWRAQFYVQ